MLNIICDIINMVYIMNKSDLKIIKKIIGLVVAQSLLFLLAKLSPISIHVLKSTFDSKIPFIPQFIYFYVSWYAMLFLIPFLLYKKNFECFEKYIWSSSISIVISFFIYFFYPTSIVRGTITLNNITGLITQFIYAIDTPILNCFPSMHCLLSFFFIFYIINLKNTSFFIKMFVAVWSLLIVASTLFVKQHILADVISAFVFAVLIFVVVEILYKKKNKK